MKSLLLLLGVLTVAGIAHPATAHHTEDTDPIAPLGSDISPLYMMQEDAGYRLIDRETLGISRETLDEIARCSNREDLIYLQNKILEGLDYDPDTVERYERHLPDRCLAKLDYMIRVLDMIY